jgi:thiamine-phosphate pyrophosphorylase
MSDTSIEECVEKSLKGGVSVVQIREKDCSGKEFLQIAKSVKEITRRYDVPLIINDRVDVAIAVGADGVHVGQDDLPCAIVRSMVGEDMIIGVSASSLTEALKAQQDGADYIGVGAMFATDTKTDAKVVTMEELDRIRREVSIPIVVIGGINKTTLPDFIGKGIDGIAVVSAIVSQNDVESAARELKSMFHK